MSGSACIFGAGAFDASSLYLPDGAFIIAADGGLEYLEKLGVAPSLTVGDFDSLGRVPEGKNVIVTPAEKDDTDTMLAVKLALQRGYDEVYIYGGMGGRFEHSLANLQALSFIALRGARGYLISEDTVCTAISCSQLSFDSGFRGYVSVFAAGGSADGVELSGLKYPLHNYTLTSDFPLGVSNEFTGEPSKISVKRGTLLVVWHFEPGSKPCFPA